MSDTIQNIWEKSGKFEGDIILTDRQRQVLLQEVSTPGLARNGLSDVSKRWPRKTLVYDISNDFCKILVIFISIHIENIIYNILMIFQILIASDQVSAIKDAMSDLERSSCIKFKERGHNDDDYVKIQVNKVILLFILYRKTIFKFKLLQGS